MTFDIERIIRIHRMILEEYNKHMANVIVVFPTYAVGFRVEVNSEHAPNIVELRHFMNRLRRL